MSEKEWGRKEGENIKMKEKRQEINRVKKVAIYGQKDMMTIRNVDEK